MTERAIVVIPTVDEVENMSEVLHRVRDAVPTIAVLVVDGASSDGTPELVEALGAELGGEITVLRQAERNGIGGAYRAGFENALGRGYDLVVEMDADLSHDPAELPAMLAAAERGAGLVIGSRYVPGGSTPGWPRRRRLLSRGGNTYARLALRLRVHDATAGYRVFRAEALRQTEYETTGADGYAFQVELAYRIALSGWPIVEHPITFRDRTRGTSKMSGRIVREAMLLVTRLGLRIHLLRQGIPPKPR